MGKFLVTVIGLASLSLTLIVAQPPRLVERYPSIGHLLEENGERQCSSFSVAATRWLTAGHCSGLTRINGLPALSIKTDKKIDLMLMEGPPAMPIPIARDEPELGSPVTLLGWTDGWTSVTTDFRNPLPYFGHVQALNAPILIDKPPAVPRNLFHEGGGPGMSGGPILNERGEAVGMVIAMTTTDESITMFSPTVKQIRTFLGLK